jgi:hypothetical protein
MMFDITAINFEYLYGELYLVFFGEVSSNYRVFVVMEFNSAPVAARCRCVMQRNLSSIHPEVRGAGPADVFLP